MLGNEEEYPGPLACSRSTLCKHRWGQKVGRMTRGDFQVLRGVQADCHGSDNGI